MRRYFYLLAALLIGFNIMAVFFWPTGLWSLCVIIPFLAIGFNDAWQSKQAIRRNFPVLGNFRYLFEMIRPEINQ